MSIVPLADRLGRKRAMSLLLLVFAFSFLVLSLLSDASSDDGRDGRGSNMGPSPPVPRLA